MSTRQYIMVIVGLDVCGWLGAFSFAVIAADWPTLPSVMVGNVTVIAINIIATFINIARW